MREDYVIRDLIDRAIWDEHFRYKARLYLEQSLREAGFWEDLTVPGETVDRDIPVGHQRLHRWGPGRGVETSLIDSRGSGVGPIGRCCLTVDDRTPGQTGKYRCESG